MKVETKELDTCKLQVHYEADPDVVIEKRQDALDSLNKVKVPGFRKGKATVDVLKVRFKKQIEEYIKREMLSIAYDDILFDTNKKSIGRPQVLSSALNGNNFTCDLVLMVKPEFELKEYKEMEIPKPHQPHSITELEEKMLQQLRMQHGSPRPYDDGDFVDKNDRITLDVEVKVDDKRIEDACKEGFLYDVGDGSFPELDDNIIGMMPDEEREFEMVLPESFGKNKGKTAQVKILLHMGTKVDPHPLDDELATKLNCKDFDDLRTKVKASVSNKSQAMEQALIGDQITNRLIENHDMEIPSWLLSMETQQVALRNNIKLEEAEEELQEEFRETAIKQIKLSLILDSIRDAEPEATLSDAEAAQLLKKNLVGKVQDPEKFFAEAQQNGTLLGMVASIQNQFTMQWLINQAKLIE